MAVLLRIDVDNPFDNSNPFETACNLLRTNYFFPALRKFGYLKNFEYLINDLNSRGIKANIYFKISTLPNKSMCEEIKAQGHEVGLHAVRTSDFENFMTEVKKISEAFRAKNCGFSKHGSGKLKLERKHTPQYEPEKYLEWAKRARMRYFLGNGEDPRIKKKIVKEVLYFPSAFWIEAKYRKKEVTVEWLINESQSRDIVVLTHPISWSHKEQVRRDYERIVSNVSKFKTLGEVLG